MTFGNERDHFKKYFEKHKKVYHEPNVVQLDIPARAQSSTCPQFWRMVEQEEVAVVVMLCRIQPGFTGCSQYFPDREFSGKLTHGEFQVETTRAVSHR